MIIVVEKKKNVDVRIGQSTTGRWGTTNQDMVQLREGHSATIGRFERGNPVEGTLHILVRWGKDIFVNGVKWNPGKSRRLPGVGRLVRS